MKVQGVNISASRTKPPARAQEPEEKYEKKGDYYQCKLCDQFTVHYMNDCLCQNDKCPSNNKKVPPSKQSTQSSAFKATTTKK